MNNEEKILNILSAVQGEVSAMRGDITSMRGDITTMQGDIASLRTDVTAMQGDIASLRTDVTAMQGNITTMQGDIASLRTDVTKINIKLENEIAPKMTALAEGQEAILDMLVTRSRVDALEEEVKLLKMVVRQMGDELQTLKKAQ